MEPTEETVQTIDLASLKPEDRPFRSREDIVAMVKILGDECVNMDNGGDAKYKYSANIAIIGALSWVIQYVLDEDVFDCVLGAGAFIGAERRRLHPIQAPQSKPLIITRTH